MVVRAMDVDWPAFDFRLRKDPFEGSAIVKAPGSAGGYLQEAIERGLEAFKAKDYKTVVDCLSQYVDELDKVTRAKLAYALKAAK